MYSPKKVKELKEKLRKRMKEYLQDKNFQKKRLQKLRNKQKYDWKYRRKMINRIVKARNNPELREIRIKNMTKTKNSKEFKEKMKPLWESEEWIERARKKISKLNKNPEFQKKRLKGLAKVNSDSEFHRRRLEQVRKKPTKPEKKLLEIFETSDLPIKYVGNNQKLIGKKNFCPDFINNKQNKLIEFNGYYTHTEGEELKRKEYFKQEGYDTLFLHYEDLEDKKQLINKVEEFLRGEEFCEN